jgi:hypothetical protein
LIGKQIRCQKKKKRDEKTPAYERFNELDIEKTSIALQMLQRACKHGILATYVLMYSWFTNDAMIKGIRRIRKGLMYVVGLCKMDARKFVVEVNSNRMLLLKKYVRV